MKTMYPGIPFSPQAVLTDNIGAADTIIKVSDVSAFPDAPNYATIGTDEDGETILYTAKTATALSGCTRGVEGTAKAWAAGELIGRNFTAADHAALIENVEEAAKKAEADGVTFEDGETFQQKYDSGELTGPPAIRETRGPRGRVRMRSPSPSRRAGGQTARKPSRTPPSRPLDMGISRHRHRTAFPPMPPLWCGRIMSQRTGRSHSAVRKPPP